jgi:tripartite-type tricarboxylate transporter receptor subunit TctC
MNIRRRNVLVAATAAVAGGVLPARAQSFPERPVRVVMPFAAGNTLDVALRQVSEEFRRNTGQSLLIEARPGGAGVIAAQAVMQAPPDGYSLLLSNISMLTINPHTFAKLPYDPEKSFRPVTGFVGTSLVMAVPASLPANDVRGFLAWAKANPSGANFASFTAGNASHFAGVILSQRSGVDLVHVPFNGTPPAVTALLGGQVNAAFLPLMAVKPHVESGKVKVLAVSSPQRSPLAPNVPTFREAGFPELEIYIWSGLSAPAGTPDAVIAKLQAEFVRAMRAPEVREKWRAQDFEALTFTPDEFRDFIRTDLKRWAEPVRVSGFKASE